MSTIRKMPGGKADRDALPLGANGRVLCRWCAMEVPPPRRTFCSAWCVHEWRLRSNPGYLRLQVQERDRGICALCRTDTIHALWVLKRARGARKLELLARWGFKRLTRRTLWDADHIVPVAEGGGECDLENIRTLCCTAIARRLRNCVIAFVAQTARRVLQQLTKSPQGPNLALRAMEESNNVALVPGFPGHRVSRSRPWLRRHCRHCRRYCENSVLRFSGNLAHRLYHRPTRRLKAANPVEPKRWSLTGASACCYVSHRMHRLLIVAALVSPFLHAQKKPVTLDDLMNRFKPGNPRPVDPVWAPDDRRFAYIDTGKLLVFDIASKTKREIIAMKTLSDAAAPVAEPEVFDWTNRRVSAEPVQWFSTGDRLLVENDGDLFVVHLDPAAPGKAGFDQLTRTGVPEVDPKLSPDNKYVSFRRDSDLYLLEIADKKVTRLTFNGSETLLNGQLDWVYPEELDLGTAHWWSPDSRHIAFLQLDTHNEPVFPQISLLKPRGQLEPERYPKAGDPNAEARVGIIDTASAAIRMLDLGDTRDHLIARVTWLPDSSAVAVMRLNRIQNHLDLIRAGLDGSQDVLLEESDPYWINVVDAPYFLKNGKEFLWESERGPGGYRHLYLYGMDGKLKHPITKGSWVMQRRMTVDEEHGRVYYMSTERSPLESQLYAVDLNGKHPAMLTPDPGVHGVSISPHGAYFTDTFSNSDSPASQTLRAQDGTALLTWMPADRSTANQYALSAPEIVEVKSTNGDTMYGRLFRPVPFDPSKKYPVIVEVYGGPGAQMVHNAWSGLSDEQLFASRGFVVWAMDNHGSTNRGHAWESVVFRDLGRHELEDQQTGIGWLKTRSYVDGARIGITGWSYGGYMTLYSLVNAPDTFKCGVAGAPVSDWRNYDTIYTERYMGLPQANADAYDHSSPKAHAADLKARLLIIHNIEDDNVHFQNTLQMADALEKAGRDFRMLVYPQKSHGVFGAYSRSLETARLNFFEENLK